MRATLLLTGFEPFDSDPRNSSWEVAAALDGWLSPIGQVRSVRLPCRFGGALQALNTALDAQGPVLVLALGQASSRRELSFERVALNLIDARIPDNDGLQPIDVPVLPRAPAAYFSNLPLKTMVNAVQALGLPAGLSCSAGTYVCNQVFYGLMHRLRRRPRVRGGFLHLPALSGPDPALSLEQLVDGTRAALAVGLAAETHGVSAGRTD